MFHKLSADDLRVGMYVVDTAVPWMQHPYLYTREGFLASEEAVEAVRAEGYTEAYIDLTRCAPGSLPPELAALLLPGAEPPLDYLPPPPKVPLAEELMAARSLYRSSLTQAKDLMDSMRRGVLELPAAEPVVDGILESLDRNADALVSLCKLRQADDYTYTHCVNVSVLCVMFARGLGLSGDKLHAVGMGGLFHDLGKSLVPLRILNAPRKLNNDEFEVMRRHPVLGHEQLARVGGVPDTVLRIVLEHHEKYNGQGYPSGMAGEDISLPGRIAAVVDVYDALSSKRVYKESMPPHKSLSILFSMRDREFHPGMVERFIRLLGVYPVGSAVLLEDGSKGVVSASDPAHPLKPLVVLTHAPDGAARPRREADLKKTGAPGIARCLTTRELGLDPGAVLGIPA